MPTVTANYSVVDGRPVHLEVTIGDAQTGSSAAYLDGQLLDVQPTIDMDLPSGGAAGAGQGPPAGSGASGAEGQSADETGAGGQAGPGGTPGNPLRGKVLLVSTTVFDVQQATDRVSVRVDLTGGLPPDFPLVQASTAQGAPVNFLTVVTFV